MSQPVTPQTLCAISSKATQAVLADLTQTYQAQTGVLWQVEAVGGVDAAAAIGTGGVGAERAALAGPQPSERAPLRGA